VAAVIAEAYPDLYAAVGFTLTSLGVASDMPSAFVPRKADIRHVSPALLKVATVPPSLRS
jgi:hypothetical protein